MLSLMLGLGFGVGCLFQLAIPESRRESQLLQGSGLSQELGIGGFSYAPTFCKLIFKIP
ncbi:hypothetical protein H6G04_27330 [Calothrix membranacea FACHB-236]|nr:hypothetical protein [Calothrix membranacea FACHB-236]